jgi:glycosyltransferase involved in cell wall biosynthesis
MTTIDVITLTHDRPQLLLEAARSVAAQTVNARVRHIIVSDESSYLPAVEHELRALGADLRHERRDGNPQTTSARLAALRNHAVAVSTADWLAFLDDDNVFEPDHLAWLLHTAMRNDACAVHSERVLFDSADAPFRWDRFPWPCPGLSDAAAIAWLEREGVIEHGSPRMHDRARLSGGRPGTVDTNEWMVTRELCLQIPWPEDIETHHEAKGIGEDGLWLRRLLDAGVSIISSQRPTLRYRLGGRFDRRAAT